MAVYTTRTLGAYMQKKGSSMSWNFSSADPEFGALQARELQYQPTLCLLYTSPSPRDKRQSRMPSSA